jgi:hypothetical protein
MRMLVALFVVISVAAHARAQVPLGPELQVNTYTTGEQYAAAIASGPSGDFVVVWHGGGNQDGSAYGVFGRRFDASGTAVGGAEFLVNEVTVGVQGLPSVAVDGAGHMVMAWVAPDGDDYGVFARRFDSAGNPRGGEFRVNTYTGGRQTAPRVTSDPGGKFIVVWQGQGPGGHELDVFAQRFSGDGVPDGGEFRVNSYTTGTQAGGDVAFYAGNFIVVWSGGNGQDGAFHGVFAQKYDGQGLPLGGEFRVNAYTTGGQVSPAVESGPDGHFVIVWESDHYPGGRDGVFAQRYDASAGAVGTEFQVDVYTAGFPAQQTVAVDASGAFVVAWRASSQNGSGYGIFARRYDATGAPEGSDFQVNSYATGAQVRPGIATDASGNFVVVWSSNGQDGDDYGVFLRRFAPDVIFKNGFESGDLSGWDASSPDAGDLSTSSDAALASSSAGLQGVVDDTVGLFVHDDSPNDENRYRARFYFDPNGFDPGEAQLHRRTRLLIGFEEGPTRRVFAVVLRRLSGAYAVMARVRLDDNSQRNTAFVPISDGPHWVELDWRRASGPDANDGRFEFWVDGVSVFSASDVDDSVSSVDFVRLGALSVKAGASGTLYWDEFESRRHGFIGP